MHVFYAENGIKKIYVGYKAVFTTTMLFIVPADMQVLTISFLYANKYY